MTAADLDYAPLTARLGVRARLRAMTGDNMKVMGFTVLGLVSLGFSIAFVAVVATGGLLSDAGLFTGVFMVVLAFSWALEWRNAGKDGRLGAFARANELTLISGESARHYAGSLFADGSHVVRVSVRTGGTSFAEVGERWSVATRKVSINPLTHRVSAPVHVPELFLRARLARRVRPGVAATELISPGLHAELTEFAGPYELELSDGEVTIFGSRRLEPEEPGRMQQAFGLLERVTTLVQQSAGGRGALTPVDPIAAPVRPVPDGRKLKPLTVIGLTLALLIVTPLLFAVVMSTIEDRLRGNEGAAQLMVGLFIAVVMVVVAALVRLATQRHQRTPLVLRVLAWVGGLAATVLVVGAVAAGISVLRQPSTEELLNDHYLEQVELRDDRVVIDGVARDDCTFDDNGWLYCDEEPQPTYD